MSFHKPPKATLPMPGWSVLLVCQVANMHGKTCCKHVKQKRKAQAQRASWTPDFHTHGRSPCVLENHGQDHKKLLPLALLSFVLYPFHGNVTASSQLCLCDMHLGQCDLWAREKVEAWGHLWPLNTRPRGNHGMTVHCLLTAATICWRHIWNTTSCRTCLSCDEHILNHSLSKGGRVADVIHVIRFPLWPSKICGPVWQHLDGVPQWPQTTLATFKTWKKASEVDTLAWDLAWEWQSRMLQRRNCLTFPNWCWQCWELSILSLEALQPSECRWTFQEQGTCWLICTLTRGKAQQWFVTHTCCKFCKCNTIQLISLLYIHRCSLLASLERLRR